MVNAIVILAFLPWACGLVNVRNGGRPWFAALLIMVGLAILTGLASDPKLADVGLGVGFLFWLGAWKVALPNSRFSRMF